MFSINGVIWKIRIVSPYHPSLIQPNGRRAIGCCDKDTNTIYISAEVGQSLLYRQVLCHEIAHAAIDSYGIDIPISEEEFLASFISVYGDEILSIVDRFT